MAELVTNYVKSEGLMATEPKFGGIVHTYQKYDPVSFPNPSSDAPDLVSPAFEHMMHYGSLKRLTRINLPVLCKLILVKSKALDPLWNG